MFVGLFSIGVLIGLISSMPIGPINLTLITTTLRTRPSRSLGIAAAVALLDGCYAFAAVSMLSILPVSFAVRTGVEVAGALLVTAYGIYLALHSRPSPLTTEPLTCSSHHYNLGIGLLTGVALYTSNPSFIAFWLGTAGAVHRWLTSTALLMNRLSFAIGVVGGTGLWFGLLLSIVRSTSTQISPLVLRRITLITGWVLMSFGSYVLIRRVGSL